ncbi:aldehyde dehydrogenase [Methylovorus sp. MM2]|uniref:xanthine dehydrogenase family protein molybdopterin-binding subunit n=1 Tax=Methylovorus sp. MM2 TaxID=1848038 RepID=UPI0007E27659|nr:xanthine dehydrogenase family protein molybdopterin-binding subunit [Methylovorus sp. MM2]OAM53365.1 aldehyde dehydrogenase [Methylovorus sp. MM2]
MDKVIESHSGVTSTPPERVQGNVNRRDFLKLSSLLGAGLMLEFSFLGAGCSKFGEKSSFTPNAFIHIDEDGLVTLVAHKVEMGQGTYTSMPMLIAEELEIDVSKVRLEHAEPNEKAYADPLLGGQLTGGSTSVRGAWKPLREAGATARIMLISAAALEWKVDPKTCRAENGEVIHIPTDRRLSYGDLVNEAARLPVPEVVVLKDPKDFKVIGKPIHRLDSPSKVNGTAQFGIDVQVPDMKIATVSASPVFGGKIVKVSDEKAKEVKGVRQIVLIDNAVAVIADHMWAAKQGLAALDIQWDDGENASFTSESLAKDIAEASKGKAAVAKKVGEPGEVMAGSGRKIEAIYEQPFLAHATMEPMNCTVHLQADSCDIWVGTQVPTIAQGAVAKLTGLPPEKVKIHNHLLGGGFGRRLEVDFIAQAVEIAKQVDSPIKVVWSREEDIQHDMYRPYYYDRISASLDEHGKPIAWSHRITGSSIMARFFPAYFKDGIDPDAIEGAVNLPYSTPNVLVEYIRHEPPFVTAFWRGVGPTRNCFVTESFMDELSVAAKKDPVEYRRALLNESPRAKAVLELAAEKAGWGTPLPAVKGAKVGRGVSVLFAFGSYIAQVAEVTVSADNEVTINRVVCAVDCGIVVNPDTVQAQMEGGIIFGASAALWGEITFNNGRANQSNFHNYRVVRMNEAPKVEVYVVPSTESPGGLGEPGTSALMPAVANAVYAATGKRIRKLPIVSTLKTMI